MPIKIENLKDSLTLWLGSVESHAELVRQEEWLTNASAEDLAKLGPEIYAGADEDEFSQFGYMVSRYESTAIIEIRGKLVPGNSWVNKYIGQTGYAEIMEAFAAAAEVPGITQVLMRIRSTGGSTDGIDETSKFIADFDKKIMPVYAQTSGNMLSAAMWIGSAARKRWSTEMASIGSVGVIAIFMEYTEAMKMAGVGVHVFREGENKALVNPYEKLTKKAKAYVKVQMAQLNTFFVQALSTNLSLSEAYVRDKIANGSEFFGAEAKELGLISKIGTFDEMLQYLEKKQGASSSQSIHKFSTGANAMSLKTDTTQKGEQTLSAEAQAAASAGAPLEAAIEAHPGSEEEITVEVTKPVEASATVEVKAEVGGLEVKAEAGGLEIMIDKLATSQKETAELTSQVTKLTTDLAAAEAGSSALFKLCSEFMQRMQIGLGLPITKDTEGMSSGALATETSRIKGLFDKEFTPGQKVTAASESDDTATQGVVTSITKNRHDAVSFNQADKA